MLKISRKHHTAGSSELPHFWVVPPFLSFRGAALSTHLPWQISQGLVRQVSLLESEAHLAALPVPAWLWSLCPVSSLTDSHIAPCSSGQDLNPGFSPASSVVMVTSPPTVGSFLKTSYMLCNDYKQMAYESNQKRVQVVAESLVSKWIVYTWTWKLFI